MSNNILTPYAASKVVNGWLKEDGIQKELPPQMFYQYTSPKKNYIPTVLTDEGKRCIETVALRSWYDTKYMKRTKVDDNQLTLDFDES